MEIKHSSEFGELEYLSPDDYYKGNWRYVGYEVDEVNDDPNQPWYDIVERDMDYRYTYI